MPPRSNIKITDESERERDDILRRLLHTPPQPRPKRDRSKGESVAPKRAKPEGKRQPTGKAKPED